MNQRISKLGRLAEWHDERGYGFLAPQDGGGRVFLHIKSLPTSGRRPKVGDWLRFSVTHDSKGRARAESVQWLKDPGKNSRRAGRGGLKPLMLLGFGVLLAVVVLMLFDSMPAYLAYLVLGMSALSFVTYALDKNAAEQGRRRVPENTLHLFSLLGGWPGALIAQQGFRHKNRKASFQGLFWLTLIANLGLMAWLWHAGDPARAAALLFGG